MFGRLLTLAVAYGASCPGFIASECICEGSAGADYTGTVDRTEEGIKCMPWKDAPRAQYRELPENYCRNGNGTDAGLWCYTEGRDWGYCDVPICDLTTTTTSTVKIVNRVISLNQSVGIRDGNTYASISANGTTSKPLKSNDYISMKLEGKWRRVKYDESGKWSFINEKQRKVGEEVDVKVAVFNKDGRKYSGAATITFDGHDAVSNAVIVDGVSNGEYAYDDRFNNISAHGRTLLPLTDESYVAVNIDGAWQKAKMIEGTWRFDSNKTRKIGGGKIEASVAVMDKNGKKISKRKYITFDGSDINKVIVLNKNYGLRTMNTFAGIEMDGKTGVPLKEGEYISVRLDGKWHRTDYDRSGVWRYKNTAERNAGENLIVTIAIFDAHGEYRDKLRAEFKSIVYNYVYKEEEDTPNRITIDSLYTGWYESKDLYSGIGGRGRTEKPLSDGQYIVCTYDASHWGAKARVGDYWECINWDDRPRGKRVQWTMELKHRNGKTLSYTKAETWGKDRYNFVRRSKLSDGYCTDTEYIGISASGTCEVDLDDGDYIAVQIGGLAKEWQRIVKFDKSGNWSFTENKVRKRGEKVHVAVVRFNGRGVQQRGVTQWDVTGSRAKDVDVLPQF